jgi:hypothetical protein
MSVENGAVAEFTVPDGMRIIKISAVAPGVCNVTTESEIEKANASIRKVFGSPQLRYEDIEPNLASLVQSLKTLESDTTPTIRSQLKGEKDTDMSNFLRHTDKGFSIVNYESGKPIINKEFGRSDGEELESVDDYKITALNVVGQPDLHSIIVSERPGATMTRGSTKSEEQYLLRLSTIVTFLQENGVKNILLFDFSCSEMTEGSERAIRNARLNLVKQGKKGGNKTETRRRKNRRYNGHSKANTHSLFRKQQATRRRKHSRKRSSRTTSNS